MNKFKASLKSAVYLKSIGYCSTCCNDTTFVSKHEWLRDHFICQRCGSIPRERALMHVIEQCYPQWPDLTIHESSPGNRGASLRLSDNCTHYIPSQYFTDSIAGSITYGIRCENLEDLTFTDESIDLHVTQDVLEHVYHPSKAFREIARTLKPGGAHIFTVPLVNKHEPSKLRAKITTAGEIEHLEPPTYHGNPINDNGSLVTVDWGFDICKHIYDSCGLFTYVYHIDNLAMGIRAEYIEVLMTIKHSLGSTNNFIP